MLLQSVKYRWKKIIPGSVTTLDSVSKMKEQKKSPHYQILLTALKKNDRQKKW